MDFLKDFLINNYVWFLIISLLLIFALIGYLAEAKKNDKIENEKEEEKTSEKKVKKSEEEQFLEANKEALANISLKEAVKDKPEEKNVALEQKNVEIEDNVVTYDEEAIVEEPVIEESVAEEPKEK